MVRHRISPRFENHVTISKNLGGVVWQSKKGPKSLLFDLWWPPDMPLGQNFCTTAFYSSLLLIWYTTWLHVCLYKMDFGPHGPGPWPCSQGSHQNSKCVPPVLIHKAITCDSFKVLAKKRLCLYKMDFRPFWATPLWPWPCPQGLHQNSECVPPVLIHRAVPYESFEILA